MDVISQQEALNVRNVQVGHEQITGSHASWQTSELCQTLCIVCAEVKTYTAQQLRAKQNSELAEICKDMGLAVSGKKDIRIKRILDAQGSNENWLLACCSNLCIPQLMFCLFTLVLRLAYLQGVPSFLSCPELFHKVQDFLEWYHLPKFYSQCSRPDTTRPDTTLIPTQRHKIAQMLRLDHLSLLMTSLDRPESYLLIKLVLQSFVLQLQNGPSYNKLQYFQKVMSLWLR